MKIARPLGLTIMAASALLALTLPTWAVAPNLYAEELPPPTVEPTEEPHPTTEPEPSGTSPKTSEHSTTTNAGRNTSTSENTDQNVPVDEDGNGHLKAPQLKTCQDRQENINATLSRMVERSQNQLNLFQAVAARVENFVTTKNLTVTNLNTLTSALQTDQAKTQNDLTALKAVDTINCSNMNPKNVINAFTADQHQLIIDMQTYKTDLTDLITAIRAAAGSKTGEDKS